MKTCFNYCLCVVGRESWSKREREDRQSKGESIKVMGG